jgi:hypothetical protein
MVDAKSKSFSLLNPYRLGNIFANSSKSSVPRQAFKRLLRSIRPPLLGLRIEFLFVISKKADLIVNENRSGSPPRDHHARDAARRDGVRAGLGPSTRQTGGRIELPQGATPEGGSRRRRGLCCSGQLPADCAFNQAALHPAYPIKRRTSAQRTQASPRRRNPGRASTSHGAVSTTFQSCQVLVMGAV